MLRTIAAILGCTILLMLLNACKENPPGPLILPFSTSAEDYLFKGGKGSTWEYLYSESTIDTNGRVTKGPEDGKLVRYTLLDSGVTRRRIPHLTVMLGQIYLNGSLVDTDTLYFSNHVGSVVQHILPQDCASSRSVVFADPVIKGASFERYGSTSNKGKMFLDEVDVQLQTKAGLFRCVNLRESYTQTGPGGLTRAMNITASIAPWNHFLSQTNVETTKFTSGKTMIETSTLEIVKIDVKN